MLWLSMTEEELMAKASRIAARQALAMEELVALLEDVQARLERVEKKVDALKPAPAAKAGGK